MVGLEILMNGTKACWEYWNLGFLILWLQWRTDRENGVPPFMPKRITPSEIQKSCFKHMSKMNLCLAWSHSSRYGISFIVGASYHKNNLSLILVGFRHTAAREGCQIVTVISYTIDARPKENGSTPGKNESLNRHCGIAMQNQKCISPLLESAASNLIDEANGWKRRKWTWEKFFC